jgi:hypothetical protein
MVLLGCCLFVGDCMVRRIELPVHWLTRWLRRRESSAVPNAIQRLDSLRSVKQQTAATQTRYQPLSNEGKLSIDLGKLADQDIANMFAGKASAESPSVNQPVTPTESLSYTERLLEAKRKSKR